MLDPSEGRVNRYAAPGGLSRVDIEWATAAIAQTVSVRAASLTAFDPSSDATGAAREAAMVKLAAGAGGSGLVLLNDATEPGVHLLAQSTGSSVRLANKDGRERLITP